MYLKFNNDDNYYEILYVPYFEDDDKIVITNTNYTIPHVEGGFALYDEDYNLIKEYNEYQYFYTQEDEYTTYTSDSSVYYVYLILDENKVIKAVILTTCVQPEDNTTILFMSGRTKECKDFDTNILDENGLYKYKFVDNQIAELTSEEQMVFKYQNDYNDYLRIKEDKIKELSDICQRKITNGIEYNGKLFSYTLADQNNLYNAFQLSQGTGLAVPYHADDETCELYSKEDIVGIYISQQTNLTHNITYFNQLKLYVESLTNVDEINSVYYGQELTGEYLDKYNEIMVQAQAITESFISGN